MSYSDISGELIHTFLTFIDKGNISKAADELGLSQPAITNQLKKFESHFPIAVFTFEGRKKVLTNYGLSIHKVLRSIEVDRQMRLDHVNAQYLTSEKLMLRIGLRKELAWRSIDRLNYDGPLEIVEMTGVEALEKLAERRLDLAVTQEKPKFDNVITVPFLQDTTEIVVHKEWAKLYGPEWYRNPSFLTEVPVLFYKPNPPFIFEWFRHCSTPVDRLSPRLICDDWALIIRSVEEKKGFSIIPNEFKYDKSKLVSYPIPEAVIPATVFFAYFFPELTSIPAFGPLIQSLRET